MKKIKLYLYCAGLGLASSGCLTKEPLPVVRPADYEFVFKDRSAIQLTNCDVDLTFWKNRGADETSLIRQASLYEQRFKLTGSVTDLLRSDSLYKAILTTHGSSPSLLQAMAANAITQHQFKPAKNYLSEALKIGDQKSATLLMLADVQLELGELDGARFDLRQIRNKNSFAFLIREAKVKDHEGKLDSAILLMEKAFERVKGNKNLFAWTKTNLADMYGHAGRIEDAYRSYLEVLRQNPNDDYAIKGIAWIALSHDHDYGQAKRLIHYLQQNKDLPEYQLLLAEIADVIGDEEGKKAALKKFNSLMTNEATKRMYAKYRAILEAEEFSNPEKAIAIAEMEIQSRPSPQSYDLLAWGYFSKGDYLRAMEIEQQYVEGQAFEPETLYHLGMIYGANKKISESRDYLTEALSSSFELGPSVTRRIENELGR